MGGLITGCRPVWITGCRPVWPVAHHLDNIYRKLDVTGRAAAVYRAVTEGMVTSRNGNRR
jgi:hypothetical protein